jgi:hypothetical protein
MTTIQCPKCKALITLDNYNIVDSSQDICECFTITAKGYCDDCMRSWVFNINVSEAI